MSTSIDTIRIDADSDESPGEASAGVVDVTGLSLRDVEAFVGDDEEEVYLERQNGRTYVVANR